MKIENYLYSLSLVKADLYIHGISSLVVEILKDNKISISDLSRELKVHKSLIYRWKQNTPISVKNFFCLCKKTTNSEFYINKAYELFTEFSSRNGNAIKLPKYLDNELSYLIGVIVGDGGISSERSTLSISGSKNELLNISKIFNKVFSINPKIISFKNYSEFIVNSLPLKYFLIYVFELPEGKKKNRIRVPFIIRKSEHINQMSFIYGFYNSDGSLSERKYNRKTLAMKQSTKILLEDINEILNKNNIKFNIYPDRTMNSWVLASFNKKEINKLLNVFITCVDSLMVGHEA